MPATQVRRDRGRFGSVRRLGGEAARRGGREGRAARRRARAHDRGLQGARARVRAPVPQPGARRHPQDAARSRRTATPAPSGTTTGSATTSRSPTRPPRASPSRWQGRMQVVGGRTNVWGRQSYRFSRARLQGRVARRLRRGLAARLRRRRAVLRPRRGLRRHHRHRRGRLRAARQSKFHPPMGMRCVERHVRQQVKKKLGWTVTLGRAANITKPINGPPALPLLRALRARLRDQVVLQLRVHDRGRRARRRATARSCRTRWSTRS